MTPEVFHTQDVAPDQAALINQSQGKVRGFSLDAYQSALIAVIGNGALGSQFARAVNLQGVGTLGLFDHDVVQQQNRTRQPYSAAAVLNEKPIELAKQLAREGPFNTTINAYPYTFQEMVEDGHDFTQYDVIFCGPDNDPTRRDVAEYGITHGLSIIHLGVGRTCITAYCFVQEPGNACLACAMPDVMHNNTYPCNTPGIVDITLSIVGFAVYAASTLICPARPRAWNFREICTTGAMPDTATTIERNPHCPLCGGHN